MSFYFLIEPSVEHYSNMPFHTEGSYRHIIEAIFFQSGNYGNALFIVGLNILSLIVTYVALKKMLRG